MIKPSFFSSSALSLVALAALTLGSACGDDPKPNKGDNMNTGDGDAQGDGDQASMDASTGGDGDDQQQGDGDGDDTGDGDSLVDKDGGLIDVDAAPDGEVVDPFEDLPDAGTDGAVLSEDEKLALAMEAKLRGCNIVTGAGKFNVGLVEDSLDRCIGNCIIRKQTFCTHLKDRLCGGKVTPFATCLQGCSTVPTTDWFQCGSTTTKVPHAAVCDDGAFQQTCPGGQDEVNCTDKFKCANGDMISSKFVCDGTFVNGNESVGGCKDQSDEKQGCAVFCNRIPE